MLMTVLRRHLMVVGKSVVSLALLGMIVAQLDVSSLSAHWHRLNAVTVIACLGLLAVQITVVAGTRLKLVLETLGSTLGLARTTQVALCGFFFEQVAFGFVGGDAMRLWLLHRLDIPVRKALEALVIDRCLGLGGLLLLVLAGLPGLVQLLPTVEDQRTVVLGCAVMVLLAGGVGVLVLAIARRYREHALSGIAEFVSVVRRDASVRRRLALVLSLAVMIQLLNVLILFLVGHDIGLPVSLRQWFSIAPAALLFSMIPISAGGWGLREGILLFSLRGLGARPEEAVVPSIVFGLGMLVVTVPGGLIWLSKRRPTFSRREAPAPTEAMSGTLR